MLRSLTPTERYTALGALAVALGLCLFTLALLWIGQPAPTGPAPAAITVIPAATSTVYAPPTPTSPADPAQDATSQPGALAIGSYVQITGTAGQGLRLRSAPGLDAPLLFLGYDAEVYQIIEGPQTASDRTWYRLVAPYDETRTGWAVVDYLTVVPTP